MADTPYTPITADRAFELNLHHGGVEERVDPDGVLRAYHRASQTYWVVPQPEKRSPLAAAIQAYMEAKGFHPTGDTGTWGHPQLGEGRRYWDCVQWQIGREIEGSDRA